MTKVSGVLEIMQDDYVAFWCPGCREEHPLRVRKGADGPRPSWTWDGDTARPTFSPSVLVQRGHYAPGRAPGSDCWCTYEARTGRKPQFECVICHSFVRSGRIEFLSDCTHALAGQTVDLQPPPGDE